jgi:hypothetical protein
VVERDLVLSLSQRVSRENDFKPSRSRYDVRSFRRDSVQRDRALDQLDNDETKLIDDLFAKRGLLT